VPRPRFRPVYPPFDPSSTPVHHTPPRASHVFDDAWFATLRARMQEEVFQKARSSSIICPKKRTMNPKQPHIPALYEQAMVTSSSNPVQSS
jgi:hypothetical protein